jgi:hypothetical protein
MSRCHAPALRWALIAWLGLGGVARAGMAMPTFTDVAQARLEVISFFLVTYLVLAFAYQRLWNSLAREFSKMPRVSYRGALAALLVCGLFIYVVLTMISGARELMTPGAWARSGVLYKIREPERDPKPWLDAARRESLERVRAELWRFAEQHAGAFPTAREAAELSGNVWRSIDPNGLSLVFVPGAKPDAGTEVIAYEPGSFGAKRMVLLSNGEIVEMPIQQLTHTIREQVQKPPAAPAKELAQ